MSVNCVVFLKCAFLLAKEQTPLQAFKMIAD